MSDSVFKKIEVVGTSAKSFSEATANAVAKAAETVRNLSWFEVVEQRGNVADGVIQGASVVRRLMDDGPDAVGDYVAEVRQAIDR